MYKYEEETKCYKPTIFLESCWGVDLKEFSLISIGLDNSKGKTTLINGVFLTFFEESIQ